MVRMLVENYHESSNKFSVTIHEEETGDEGIKINIVKT